MDSPILIVSTCLGNSIRIQRVKQDKSSGTFARCFIKFIFVYLEDGSNLACALANKSALVFSLPLTNKGGTSYTGILSLTLFQPNSH